MKRLVILGFGGYGKTIEDVVLDAGLFDEIVFLDDGSTDEKVQGKCSDYVKYYLKTPGSTLLSATMHCV